MAKYTFTLQTLTPLFIGNGEELRMDFDYTVRDGGTWRLKNDAILQDKYQDGKSYIPGKLLSEADYQNPAYFRYRVRGKPRSEKTDARLKACIKDVHDCPYIPGSSIKGAIRTVLAKRAIASRKIGLHDRIGYGDKTADDWIEQEIFGKGSVGESRDFPREDLFRALQVSDALMDKEKRKPAAGIRIVNVTPKSRHTLGNAPTVPIELEAIGKGQSFNGTITLDDFLLNGAFRDRHGIFNGWIDTLHDSGYQRLEWLINEWFAGVDNSESVDQGLRTMLTLKDDPRLSGTTYALIQIGGGTGWDGMTYGELLQKEEPTQFETLLRKKNILKSTRGGFPRREIGEVFPSSKKVVQNQEAEGKPESLLGWCLIVFEKVSG